MDEATQTLLQYSGDAENVTVPDGIKYIGNNAFEGKSVKQVVLPDSVIGIGNYAFCGCSELTSVRLPDSLLSIGDYAFYNCYELGDLQLPESLLYIGDYAFSWCEGIDGSHPYYDTVYIPAGVIYLSAAQQSYPNYSDYIACPKFDIAAENAFYRVQDGMLIGRGILMDYYDPTEGNPCRIVTVPDDVTVIGELAFSTSHVLQVILPDGLQEIRQAAFNGCSYLLELTIDLEKVKVARGCLYENCGFKAYEYDESDQAKSAKESLGYIDCYDQEMGWIQIEYEPVSEQVLAALPDTPVLTLLNIGECDYDDGDVINYMIWASNDYYGSNLNMDICCDQEWVLWYQLEYEARHDGE